MAQRTEGTGSDEAPKASDAGDSMSDAVFVVQISESAWWRAANRYCQWQ